MTFFLFMRCCNRWNMRCSLIRWMSHLRHSKAAENLSPVLLHISPCKIQQVRAKLEEFVSVWTIAIRQEAFTFSFFSHPTPASCGVLNTHYLPAAAGRKWQVLRGINLRSTGQFLKMFVSGLSDLGGDEGGFLTQGLYMIFPPGWN